MTTKLTYTGSVTTSAMGINAELNPGDSFYVPDEMAESFLCRSDMEIAVECPVVEAEDTKPEAVTKPKKTAQPEPATS